MENSAVAKSNKKHDSCKHVDVEKTWSRTYYGKVWGLRISPTFCLLWCGIKILSLLYYCRHLFPLERQSRVLKRPLSGSHGELGAWSFAEGLETRNYETGGLCARWESLERVNNRICGLHYVVWYNDICLPTIVSQTPTSFDTKFDTEKIWEQLYRDLGSWSFAECLKNIVSRLDTW
ncbi:hypothetical protein BDV95DRAFT_7954 [Massariosphaeria phaeospora]|uniref:Uncharacterized protein n=1 Tax=Massariosphaeria phaeospora TaxID=100035 RepID=A0A7C8MIY1_9PLEO|nr:hypothetical protein BDV95DRAFT_7954 [Massariosphaeria phaeospora]